MKFKTFLAQFFQDGDGLSSSTRLAFLTWSLGVFIIWALACITSKSLVSIPQTVVEMSMVFISGKVTGSWVESINTNNSLPIVKAPEPPITNLPPGFQLPP